MNHRTQLRPGFSMVEVLIVMGLLALLFAFFAPALSRVRSAAARSQGTNNLKQIGLACHNFHDVHKKFPFNGLRANPARGGDFSSASWAFQVLPFIEQENVFRAAAADVSIAVYMCPARKRAGQMTEGKFKGPTTDYAINCWLNAPKNGSLSAPNRNTTFVNITDGTSNTILIGQLALRTTKYGLTMSEEWHESFFFGGMGGSGRAGTTHVKDAPDSPFENLFGGPFEGGTLFAFADGSVRFLSTRVDLRIPLGPDDGMVFRD